MIRPDPYLWPYYQQPHVAAIAAQIDDLYADAESVDTLDELEVIETSMNTHRIMEEADDLIALREREEARLAELETTPLIPAGYWDPDVIDVDPEDDDDDDAVEIVDSADANGLGALLKAVVLGTTVVAGWQQARSHKASRPSLPPGPVPFRSSTPTPAGTACRCGYEQPCPLLFCYHPMAPQSPSNAP
jgi:hypothetical protein